MADENANSILLKGRRQKNLGNLMKWLTLVLLEEVSIPSTLSL